MTIWITKYALTKGIIEKVASISPHFTGMATVDEPGPSFEQFYKLYPRHEAGSVARKSWTKLSIADKIEAIDGLANHIKYWIISGTHRQFIPLPATWLNQRRWEDSFECILPDQAYCAWPKCRNYGSGIYGTGTTSYCEQHLSVLKRGGTPPR